MPKLVFYRQERQDGAIRTAIELDDDPVLGRLENEADLDHDDPRLAWWVDLRCKGQTLPTEPEEARHWLVDNSSVICKAFRTLAKQIRAGMDGYSFPLSYPIQDAPSGIGMTIVCCAVNRVTGREMPKILSLLAAGWKKMIIALPAVESV